MIFSSKYLVPAAAFAAVASVAISAPAQALSLNGGIGFTGGVDIYTDNSAGTPYAGAEASDYFFDFANFGSASTVNGSGTTIRCSGDFNCTDRIRMFDFGITGGALNSEVNPFIRGISTTAGNVSFQLKAISFFDDTSTPGSISFNMEGFFVDAGEKVAGKGTFSGEVDLGLGTFSGNLTAVPTPAAVLPILAGLFGAASKRKRDGEEA